MEEGIPLIIPLKAQESYQGHNDELKILLRSVEKNVGRCSCVCIVADRLPEWLNAKADGLRWVRQGDPYTQCKDANLFLKMRVAIQVLGLSGQDRWCFSADDGAFLQPCDLPTLPLIYNTTFYYLLGEDATLGYLALMTVIAFFFIWPSRGKMDYEMERAKEQQEK
jgi:hypothetical protein